MKEPLKRLLMTTVGRGRIAGLAIAATLVFSPAATHGQAASQVLKGNAPRALSRLHLHPLGQMQDSQKLKLAIGLPLRNRESLTNLLRDIYDPTSPNYHQYLGAEEFAKDFGPTEKDYQAVIDYAASHGLRVTGTYPNRTLVDVEASVATVQQVFHVQLQTYRHPSENRIFFAPDRDPSLDLNVPLLTIRGLDNYVLPKPLLSRAELNVSTNGHFDGSGPYGTFLGTDFRKAYVPGATLTGSGQTVALFECDGYYSNDITLYVKQAKIPFVPLQNVFVDGFDGTPGEGNDEVSLDIDMVMCMAPGLSKIIVYQGPDDTSAIDTDILNAIATDNKAKQISSSWLIDDTAQHDQIYQQFAAQGQSFFQASGDEGAYFPGIFQFEDSPYVTLVGGTTLTTDTNGAWISETVWNWRNEFGSAYDGIAGGGGISTVYPIPSWQQGINMNLNGGSVAMRNIPDVALTADNIFIYGSNGYAEPGVGGTSCAAPLWAGFMAMVNQQAANTGLTPLGFINPTIYSIGKSGFAASGFHDIVTGDNTSSLSPDAYFAVPGYDLCTGWGTPKGTNLINAMLSLSRSGLLQISVNPPPGSALIASLNQTIAATVSDVQSINNATVMASVPGVVTNLAFSYSGGGVYTGTIQAPASGSFVMTISATATNEFPITNHVIYNTVALPQNDLFATPTKVPAAGGTYLANNSLAHIEAQEPAHGGDANDAASLWWEWMPTTSTNVFVDTTGSAIPTVIGVYTGSSLGGLATVAGAYAPGSTRPVFLNFNALAGTTYHIAVASATASSMGSIHFAISPGGSPDTNKPVVLVSSPLNGSWLTNKIVTLQGTASDPPPGSGLSQVLFTVNNQWQFAADGTTNWTAPIALSTVMQNGLNRIQVTAQDFAGNVSDPVNMQLNFFSLGPVNDLFVNATPLTGDSGAVSASNTNATKEFGEPNHAGNTGGKSLWWTFTPSADGVLTLDTTGSSFDTLMGLYLGNSLGNLTPIAANDDASPYVTSSLITQAVRSNQVYHVAVDGYDGASGAIFLNYSFAPTPVYQLSIGSSAGGTAQASTVNSAGGIAVMPGATGDFADNTSVTLTAAPNSYYQFNSWSGSASSSNNPLSIVIHSDVEITPNFGSFPFTEGFESGDLSHLAWVTSGNAPWFVQSSVVAAGRFAARSGYLGDNQSSSLVLTTNFVAGAASFDFKVSSETNYDFLNFYVDGALVQRWSGTVDWGNFSFNLTTNNHVLEWRYTKDPSLSSGLDAAFIDDLILPLANGSAPAPARLGLSRGSNGALILNLQGQLNQRYILQTSSDLVHWINLSTNTAVGGQIDLAVPSGTNQSQFYRAVGTQ